MIDDILSRATRALHEDGEATADDAKRLRASVMITVRERRRKRARLLTLAIPIAAVLVGASAWAAVTGKIPFFSASSVNEPVNATGSTSTSTSTSAGTGSGAALSPEPEPEPVTVPVPASPTASPSAATTSPSAATAPSAKPIPSAKPAPSTEAADADLALYKRAHQLHFVQHDHAAALAAWNEYLAQFPGGTFGVEARYNRAVCLVKLGRHSEARVALKPFADGQVAGGYRQHEAAALLEALDTKSEPGLDTNP